MKDILGQERGVSLISLAAVIIVIGIITTMILWSNSGTTDIEKTYKDGNIYTNQDIDTEKVNLRYVDGVRIYDGYNYVSGNKKSGIIIGIKGDEENLNTQYKWTVVEKKIANISELGSINIGSSKVEEFIRSVNEYQGYYVNSSDDVLYFLVDENDEDAWSAQYEEEATYVDKDGNKAYIPKGFKVSKISSMNTVEKGLVIKNSETGIQYVWIDVPKKALQDSLGNTLDTVEEIENNLKSYAASYREDRYSDTYYEGCIGGNKQEEYNNLKNEMYQSIKDNGGFWISRNEVEESSCYNAYGKASAIEIEGRTSCLMFGIQWDLMCEFLKSEDTTEGKDILNIKDLVGNGEITLESILTNSQYTDSGNKTVLRGRVSLNDRDTISWNQSASYRTTIF